jgi:hypothetical protein
MWSVSQGRPRVLIEYPDFGVGHCMASILQRNGFATAVCGGPDHLNRRRCPLVHSGRCEAAEDADVIVHGLNPDRPEHEAVLQALRSRCSNVPTIVEVPGPSVERHRTLLSGCTLMGFPATGETLLDAVRNATSGR